MNYYLMISVLTNVVILTQCIEPKREKIFNIHPGVQGIGKVLNTLYDEDESLCAVHCMTTEICISYNMLSMPDGTHCQFLETIDSIKANVNSTMYGKNDILFIV